MAVPHPKKILAIKLRALGDTVLMTAALQELRRAYPAAEIHAAVLTPWAPLLDPHPAVDRVWTYDRHRDRAARAKAAARLALRLRSERFDCVVNFHASPSSAMVSFASGAKLRSIHFHGHRDKNRYSSVVVPGKGVLKPIIERDMDAVRALGIAIPEGRMPRIFLEPAEIQWAKEFIGQGTPLLALAPGASRPTKAWPVDRFASVAVDWCKRKGGSAIALMGPADGILRDDFIKAVDHAAPADLRGKISAENRFNVRQLAAILNQASVLVTNDSGPKHVAIAVETPTVTLFGPEHPFEWHPYPEAENPYFFVENLACRRDAAPGMPPWCGLDLCIQEQYKCMRMISAEAVLEKCIEVAKTSARTLGV